MPKTTRLAQLLAKHEHAFYVIVLLLAILGAVLSGLFSDETQLGRILAGLLLNLSAALLVLAMIYGLRRFLFIDRKQIQSEPWLERIHHNLDRIVTALDAGKSIADADEYYSSYFRQITSATQSVSSIGDGFACHTSANRSRARSLIQAMRRALDNGVVVRRFQFQNTLSLDWLDMLLELKEQYGERFQLLMNQELDPPLVPFVICITDHGLPSASVTVMFTISADTTLQEKLGGPAFVFERAGTLEDSMFRAFEGYFSEGQNQSSGDLRQLRLVLETKRREMVESALREGLEASLDETGLFKIGQAVGILDIPLIHDVVIDWLTQDLVVYFAYGSNLPETRIRARVPSAKFIGVAELDNYRLTFNIKGNSGEGRGGGIANVVPDSETKVCGHLYALTQDDFDSLAEIEEKMGYSMQELKVSTRSGHPVTAVAFIAKGDHRREYPPQKEYRRLIEQGLHERGIEEDYRKKLLSHLTGLNPAQES